MKVNTLLISSLFAVTLLTGCDKGSEQSSAGANNATNAGSAAVAPADSAKEGFGPVVESATTAGSQAIDETKDAVGSAANAVQENVTNAADQAADAAQEAGKDMAQGAEKAVEGAQNMVTGAAESVKNAADAVEDTTAKAVEEIKK
jgi:hypothetical protein